MLLFWSTLVSIIKLLKPWFISLDSCVYSSSQGCCPFCLEKEKDAPSSGSIWKRHIDKRLLKEIWIWLDVFLKVSHMHIPLCFKFDLTKVDFFLYTVWIMKHAFKNDYLIYHTSNFYILVYSSSDSKSTWKLQFL